MANIPRVLWTSAPAGRAGALRYVPLRDGRRVSYGEVLQLWQDDESFRHSFLEALAAAPVAAYRWETPPVSAATLQRDFEFVLLDAPGLRRPPEAEAFAEQFGATGSDQTVIDVRLDSRPKYYEFAPYGEATR